MPGVVSHATNLVEHPQLVADRILRYAAIVGRENVVPAVGPTPIWLGRSCKLLSKVHAGVQIPLALEAGRDGGPKNGEAADPPRAIGRHKNGDNGCTVPPY